MIIRQAVLADFEKIKELLQANFMNAPDSFDEIRKLFFIAEKDKEIIGTIWALAGESTRAYIGYLAVVNTPEKSRITACLFQKIIQVLKDLNVTKIMFHTEKWNRQAINIIYKHFKKSSITKLPDLYYFQKEI